MKSKNKKCKDILSKKLIRKGFYDLLKTTQAFPTLTHLIQKISAKTFFNNCACFIIIDCVRDLSDENKVI